MKNFAKNISNILHVPALIIFIIIAVLFLILIAVTFYELFHEMITSGLNYHHVLEKIFRIFLYVELIAAIKLYFKNNYHFPLRFFLYIGITDILRRIFISIENANEVFYYSLAVLVLIMALFLLDAKFKFVKKNKAEDENSIEV